MSVKSFDATNDFTFSFRWPGNQSFGSKLKIYQNSTLALVVESTATNFKLENTVNGNTLANGVSYVAEIASIDSTGVESSFSDKISFTCYSTPVFNFSNIVDNQTVSSANLVCNLLYSQAENEPLNSYKVMLYSFARSQLISSNVLFDTENLTYTFSGLSDNTQYHIRAEGETVHGMALDTGYVLVNVDYVRPSTFATVELENLPSQASVQVKANLVMIEGEGNPEHPTYIDESVIDLTQDGSYVVFDEGYSINGNFSTQMLLRNPTAYTTIYTANKDSHRLRIQYMVNQFIGDSVNKSYFVLTAENAITEYRIATEPMTLLSSEDWVRLYFKRVNNLYEIISERVIV